MVDALIVLLDQYGIPTMGSSTVVLSCLIFFLNEKKSSKSTPCVRQLRPAFPRDAYVLTYSFKGNSS